MKGMDRFFLGGNDLEMEETRKLLGEVGCSGQIHDRGLAWGARASTYLDEIRAALAGGDTPVLIELDDDLPSDIDRNRLVLIDHHGSRAGLDRPSALRQVFERVGKPHGAAWTRWRNLVEANDVGHADLMRKRGASSEEIRAVRDADRRAQGITSEVEAESRRATSAAERRGTLLVIRTSAPTSTAIMDQLLPEYGGIGSEDTVVSMDGKIAFYGRGSVIQDLAETPMSWSGGALPEHGYWGTNIAPDQADMWIDRITLLTGNRIP